MLRPHYPPGRAAGCSLRSSSESTNYPLKAHGLQRLSCEFAETRSMSTKSLGDRGEELAASYLEDNGYVILDRNYRFERAEVDLICFAPPDESGVGGELVFAEVKTRSGLGFGRPEEAVSRMKRRHIVRAAQAYLHERRLEKARCRFDVISILLRPDGEPEIEHFERAFWAY